MYYNLQIMRRTKEQLNAQLELALKFYKENKITLQYCSKEFSIDRHILSKYFKTKDIVINPNGKQNINSDIFKIIDTEEKAYWLGFLYADGNISDNNTISLELSTTDKNHLVKFNSFLNKSLDIREDKNRVRCIFKDTKIKNDLVNLGCIPRKSLILKFPKDKQVPKNLKRHFVRGYIDGDGSIYKTNNNIHISILGTKHFLENLVKYFRLKERTLYKNNKNNNSNCYFIQFSGKLAIKVIELFYNDCNIKLERKYNKFVEYEKQK